MLFMLLWNMKRAKKSMQLLIGLRGLGDVERENCTFFNTSIKFAAVKINISMLKQCNIMLVMTCSMYS